MRRAASLLLLVTLAACGDPHAPPPPSAVPAGDPYAPVVEPTTPTGPPVRVTLAPPGRSYRTTGTLSYRQAVAGTTGRAATPGTRTLDGTVDLRWRTEGVPGGVVTTVVEGRLETTERSAGAGERRRVDPVTLRFEHEGHGGAVHRTIRLDAPAHLRDALEALQAAWTDRFRLPDAEVRVGQSFQPTDVIGLDEALRRPLYFLFVRRAQMGDAVGAPIEGRVWVAAREVHGGTDVLATRVAVTHAYEGDTDVPPLTKDNVRVAWRAAVEGTVRVAVDGGWARTYDVARRRRVAFRAQDLDYVVEIEGRATLETVPERP